MPKPRKEFRILIYICMFLFAGLSIGSLLTEGILYAVKILIYCVAAISMLFGVYYLITDIRYLIRNVIEPEIRRNKYTAKVVSDYRLRTVLFTIPGAGINVLFALFNGVMAIINQSAWLGTLSAYYVCLSIMRIGAVSKKNRTLSGMNRKDRMKQEIDIYKRNSIFFVLLAIVMAGMVILLIRSLGGKTYPGYMIYVAAMFAFYKIIVASINMIRVNKEKSPLLTIIRRIGHVDACVSILTLQTAMFASFGDDQQKYQNLMNGITGSVVCLLVLGMGIFGISQTGKLKHKYLSQMED